MRVAMSFELCRSRSNKGNLAELEDNVLVLPVDNLKSTDIHSGAVVNSTCCPAHGSSCRSSISFHSKSEPKVRNSMRKMIKPMTGMFKNRKPSVAKRPASETSKDQVKEPTQLWLPFEVSGECRTSNPSELSATIPSELSADHQAAERWSFGVNDETCKGHSSSNVTVRSSEGKISQAILPTSQPAYSKKYPGISIDRIVFDNESIEFNTIPNQSSTLYDDRRPAVEVSSPSSAISPLSPFATPTLLDPFGTYCPIPINVNEDHCAAPGSADVLAELDSDSTLGRLSSIDRIPIFSELESPFTNPPKWESPSASQKKLSELECPLTNQNMWLPELESPCRLSRILDQRDTSLTMIRVPCARNNGIWQENRDEVQTEERIQKLDDNMIATSEWLSQVPSCYDQYDRAIPPPLSWDEPQLRQIWVNAVDGMIPNLEPIVKLAFPAFEQGAEEVVELWYSEFRKSWESGGNLDLSEDNVYVFIVGWSLMLRKYAETLFSIGSFGIENAADTHQLLREGRITCDFRRKDDGGKPQATIAASRKRKADKNQTLESGAVFKTPAIQRRASNRSRSQGVWTRRTSHPLAGSMSPPAMDRRDSSRTTVSSMSTDSSSSFSSGRASQVDTPLTDYSLHADAQSPRFSFQEDVYYRCSEPGCDAEFIGENLYNRSGNYKRHMDSTHGGIRFRCDDCSTSFNRKDNLLSHCRKRGHGKDVPPAKKRNARREEGCMDQSVQNESVASKAIYVAGMTQIIYC